MNLLDVLSCPFLNFLDELRLVLCQLCAVFQQLHVHLGLVLLGKLASRLVAPRKHLP